MPNYDGLVNFVVRVEPEFRKQIQDHAESLGMTSSRWARSIFMEKLSDDARENAVDGRLDEIVKAYRALNDEGREHLVTCAMLAASNKEMRR